MARLSVCKPIEGNQQAVYGYLTIDMSVNSSGRLVVSASFASAGVEGDAYTFLFKITHNGSSNTFTTTGSGSTSYTYTLNKSGNVSITASSSTSGVGSVYLGAGSSVATSSTYYLSLSIPNTAPTVSFYGLPTLYAGKNATISWTTSDSDGDTVTTTKLVRYYKASGASSYSSTTLTTSNVRSYTDTIPKSLGGGSVYYVVTFTDGSATNTVTSSTFTIQQSCNVNVIINGIITEASDVATINNGVITIMDGELHSIISGVIT